MLAVLCQGAGPPHGLCIQHEEWCSFSVPSCTGMQSSVYYHYVACVCAVWPLFDGASVIITPELQGCL